MGDTSLALTESVDAYLFNHELPTDLLTLQRAALVFGLGHALYYTELAVVEGEDPRDKEADSYTAQSWEDACRDALTGQWTSLSGLIQYHAELYLEVDEDADEATQAREFHIGTTLSALATAISQP